MLAIRWEPAYPAPLFVASTSTCMTAEKSPGRTRGYIDVDGLQRELSLQGDVVERIARYYGRELPELHRTQQETRLACLFTCGREGRTGDRVLSIKEQPDGCLFRCFHYGCTVRGNLLTLMHWMKHDRPPSGERLQGGEFREIAEDLRRLVAGDSLPLEGSPRREEFIDDESAPEKTIFNVPLKDSENERARELVTLDERFVTDVSQMNPKAAAYVRRRPFLTQELMKKFRCGYLPQDAGSLLRGQFVYGWANPEGEILTWFGRNLNYEDQHVRWERSGESKDEPSKFRFVKGFQRGLELYGENQLLNEADRDLLKQLGIIVVEGPNDVLNLHSLGIPSVAVCSNTITETQADKLASLAKEFGEETVSVMFDLDREGENGARQAILALSERCRVRNLWTSGMQEGEYCGRQPESLTREEWDALIRSRWFRE